MSFVDESDAKVEDATSLNICTRPARRRRSGRRRYRSCSTLLRLVELHLSESTKKRRIRTVVHVNGRRV